MPANHKEIEFETAIEESLLAHGGVLTRDPAATAGSSGSPTSPPPTA